jgi:hypothetical protein
MPLPEAYRSLLRPSSPDDAKASIICCNWFMQTHSILGVYLTFLHNYISVCLNFQRTKFITALEADCRHPTHPPFKPAGLKWWAQMDLNHRPRAYQARALTN